MASCNFLTGILRTRLKEPFRSVTTEMMYGCLLRCYISATQRTKQYSSATVRSAGVIETSEHLQNRKGNFERSFFFCERLSCLFLALAEIKGFFLGAKRKGFVFSFFIVQRKPENIPCDNSCPKRNVCMKAFITAKNWMKSKRECRISSGSAESKTCLTARWTCNDYSSNTESNHCEFCVRVRLDLNGGNWKWKLIAFRFTMDLQFAW